MEVYNNKTPEYKRITAIDSYCMEFESFFIKELKKNNDIEA